MLLTDSRPLFPLLSFFPTTARHNQLFVFPIRRFRPGSAANGGARTFERHWEAFLASWNLNILFSLFDPKMFSLVHAISSCFLTHVFDRSGEAKLFCNWFFLLAMYCRKAGCKVAEDHQAADDTAITNAKCKICVCWSISFETHLHLYFPDLIPNFFCWIIDVLFFRVVLESQLKEHVRRASSVPASNHWSASRGAGCWSLPNSELIGPRYLCIFVCVCIHSILLIFSSEQQIYL